LKRKESPLEESYWNKVCRGWGQWTTDLAELLLVVTFGEAKRHDEIDLQFASHVTYVVGNCRRLRLRK
jgi:hypothetical protein